MEGVRFDPMSALSGGFASDRITHRAFLLRSDSIGGLLHSSCEGLISLDGERPFFAVVREG